ncbi:MAG: hypothetical protein AB203_03880 [Parcubacteria bacterium C7867-008]|nr:MAG: hypothetical protein AB203_03880 [Parcubacteria bacterium C7867-008]
MAAQPIDNTEQHLMIGASFLADTIGLIPVIGNFVWFAAYVSLTLYFLIKLGPSYLGGKNSDQKMAKALITGIIGAIPVIGNIAPDLLILTVTTFRMHNKEVAEEEHKMQAATQAANDNVRRNLSRAA